MCIDIYICVYYKQTNKKAAAVPLIHFVPRTRNLQWSLVWIHIKIKKKKKSLHMFATVSQDKCFLLQTVHVKKREFQIVCNSKLWFLFAFFHLSLLICSIHDDFFSFGNLHTYRAVCLSSFHFCLLYIYCLNLFQAREKKKAQTYQCLIDVPIIKIHLLYLSIKMLMFQLYFNVNLTWWNAIIMKFWMPYGSAWTCIQFQTVCPVSYL